MTSNTIAFSPNQAKGMFILYPVSSVVRAVLMELMERLNCEVLSEHKNRVLVKTSRNNLNAIKKCWLKKDPLNKLSQALNQSVSQIIIGA